MASTSEETKLEDAELLNDVVEEDALNGVVEEDARTTDEKADGGANDGATDERPSTEAPSSRKTSDSAADAELFNESLMAAAAAASVNPQQSAASFAQSMLLLKSREPSKNNSPLLTAQKNSSGMAVPPLDASHHFSTAPGGGAQQPPPFNPHHQFQVPPPGTFLFPPNPAQFGYPAYHHLQMPRSPPNEPAQQQQQSAQFGSNNSGPGNRSPMNYMYMQPPPAHGNAMQNMFLMPPPYGMQPAAGMVAARAHAAAAAYPSSSSRSTFHPQRRASPIPHLDPSAIIEAGAKRRRTKNKRVEEYLQSAEAASPEDAVKQIRPRARRKRKAVDEGELDFVPSEQFAVDDEDYDGGGAVARSRTSSSSRRRKPSGARRPSKTSLTSLSTSAVGVAPRTSIFRGVSCCGKDRKWQARIRDVNKVKYLGRFVSQVDAARAYDKAARARRGEAAQTNFKEMSHEEYAQLKAHFDKHLEIPRELLHLRGSS